MSVTPRAPGPKTVYGESKLALTTRMRTGRDPIVWILVRKIIPVRGRRRTNDVAAWAARIESPEFLNDPELDDPELKLDSLPAKAHRLAWLQHIESGGDPDINPAQLKKLAKSRYVALHRWYKKRS